MRSVMSDAKYIEIKEKSLCEDCKLSKTECICALVDSFFSINTRLPKSSPLSKIEKKDD